MDKNSEIEKWPRAVEEAVNRIVLDLSKEDKKTIRNTSPPGMIQYHHSLGTWVRNTFGLWRGNDELLRSCGCHHPDDASDVILSALWQKLHIGASASN